MLQRTWMRGGLILLISVLSACSQTPQGRYAMKKDAPPLVVPDHISLDDAEVTFEKHNPTNQRSYTIRGKTYYPMEPEHAITFSQQGQASWYGQKFHGHLTSNGETYDMYAMTAAHKTLPLPSFVQVTNKANGKQAIVRVNDRGPFHGGRIIDLSYAAAKKLDVLKTGVANVEIKVVSIDAEGNTYLAGKPMQQPETLGEQTQTVQTPSGGAQTKPSAPPVWFVQVLALQDGDKALQLAKGLKALYQTNIHTPQEMGVHKLRLGPLADEQTARTLAEQLKSDGYSAAFPLLAPL